jgi:hypothetical protein
LSDNCILSFVALVERPTQRFPRGRGNDISVIPGLARESLAAPAAISTESAKRDTRQKRGAHLCYTFSMKLPAGYLSATQIVSYIDEALGDEPAQNEVDTVLRVLPKLVYDWRALTDGELALAVTEPPLSRHREFNALFEGIVAYFFHTELQQNAPAWTGRTYLDKQWIARRHQVEKGGERLYFKIWQNTPIEMLERGLLFSRSEMNLL